MRNKAWAHLISILWIQKKLSIFFRKQGFNIEEPNFTFFVSYERDEAQMF